MVDSGCRGADMRFWHALAPHQNYHYYRYTISWLIRHYHTHLAYVLVIWHKYCHTLTNTMWILNSITHVMFTIFLFEIKITHVINHLER